jgi:hypothetical protein
METYSTRAADWMAGLQYDDLPPDVMDAALQ